MEITILGFKFRLEILILIVVVYFIMACHLLYSCTTYPLIEGAANIKGKGKSKKQNAIAKKIQKKK